jgi:hypothetical protein
LLNNKQNVTNNYNGNVYFAIVRQQESNEKWFVVDLIKIEKP